MSFVCGLKPTVYSATGFVFPWGSVILINVCPAAVLAEMIYAFSLRRLKSGSFAPQVTNDTLVFYMSAETLGSVVENLFADGISNDRKLAVIGQATTPQQKLALFDLKDFKEQQYISQTIAIIGRVV